MVVMERINLSFEPCLPELRRSSAIMEPHPDLPMTDHACPMVFLVVPTFVGALVWLCFMLNYLPSY